MTRTITLRLQDKEFNRFNKLKRELEYTKWEYFFIDMIKIIIEREVNTK